MHSLITAARRKARKAQEMLYEDVFTAYRFEKSIDENGIVENELEPILENVPCRLSYSGGGETRRSETADNLTRTIRLFFSPDVELPAGCRLAISRQGGEPVWYENSGAVEQHATHGQTNLKLLEEHP